MKHTQSFLLAILFTSWIPVCMGADPLTADEAAAVLLDSANRAFNEQKRDFAAERYREFLKLYPANRDVPRANYGLGLSLIEGPKRDFEAALPPLQAAATRPDFADRPMALYYLGLARRGLGDAALLQATTKPAPEGDALRNTANQRFGEAAGSFAEAATAFAARAATASPAATERPPDLNWAAQARCDGTDLLLRLAKWKEAAEAAEAFLADPALKASPYRELALYHLGYARFGLKEHLVAGRALRQLAPFQQEFGTHTRYLLGRVHHLSGEQAEASIQYRAALADYDQRKKTAQQALQNPAALTPEKRATYEALQREPAPEYLSRASFYLALAACEAERFPEALDGFTTFIQQNPKSPYIPDAQLRQGFCRLQAGNYAEAAAVLQTLTNQPPRADRALWWLARSQIKQADPKNPQAYEPAMKTATDNLRHAADLAGQLAPSDPDAKTRRGEVLMDLADTLMTLKLFREAADTYQRVVQENTTPNRAEEAAQRRITALHLGGFYPESNDLAAQFEQTYPRSTLLPAVIFRRAENVYLTAMTLSTNTAALATRAQELPRLFGEAVAHYQRLIDNFPDDSSIPLAREAIGACYYRMGKYREALSALNAIPSESYGTEIANTPYMLANCLIRCAPQDPPDAIAVADLLGKAERAATLLNTFINANDKSPQLPDALLKLGWCYSRIAETAAGPEERKKALTAGRAAYDRLIQQFAQDTAIPGAVFERAGCMASMGDNASAITELGRFTQDPLRQSAIAPLALIRMADLMRTQNRAPDAAAALQQYRTQCETNLLKDPIQADKVPQLQYEHALSLKQAGKTAEARAIFEGVLKDFPGHPAAANAAWRAAQCRREELTAQMDAARQAAARQGIKPEELTAAQRALTDAMNGLRDALTALLARADALGKSAPGSPPHLCALYESAWCGRTLADVETESTLRQMRQEAVAKIQAKLARQLPAGQTPNPIREPDIPLSEVAAPLSERTAMECYERLIAAAPDALLAGQAGLELAELLARRSRYDDAVQVLGNTLTRKPPQEIIPQIRVQLAAARLGMKEPATTASRATLAKAALAQAELVASDATSPLAGYARYLMGEAYVRQQDWSRTIERLLPFRDQPALQNLPNVSDRALLRLGQAYLESAQWDPCRQTLGLLTQRFPRSAWTDEALYSIGRSLHKQEQYDQAVAAYQQLAGRTASEWGAQAQIQIGLCRLAQKRYPEAVQALLAMPLTYDYPEWQAPAYCEAARVYVEMKQPEEATRLLQKVARDYAASPWAQTARERLAELGSPKG